jgi:hypothetical protein
VQRSTWIIILLIVAMARTLAQVPAAGEISGRIADVTGDALPGARVTITSGDERREAVTDAEGRFALPSLRLGTYTVVVELPGFRTVSGTITLSSTVRRAHVGWRLEVGCLAESSHVTLAPRDAAPLADAIAHVQVASDDGPVLWTNHPECPGTVVRFYTAEILKEVVLRSSSGDRGTTLRIVQRTYQDRLQVGAEYVALRWPGGGAALVVPIVSRRISSGVAELPTGMAVDDALELLGQWSREQPR